MPGARCTRGLANVCLELEQRHCDPLARNDAYN